MGVVHITIMNRRDTMGDQVLTTQNIYLLTKLLYTTYLRLAANSLSYISYDLVAAAPNQTADS